MKKKTSLWISGITTVAMLAVAVGSFAAWDTLTAKTVPDFAATSGDPVIIEVMEGNETFTDNKLVSEDAEDSVAGDKDVKELTGIFTPTLTDEGSKAKIQAKVTVTMGETGSETTSIADTNLNYKLVNLGTDGTGTDVISITNGTAVDLPVSGNQYKLVVTMKTPADTNAAKGVQGKNIKAQVECSAVKATPAP